MTVLGISVGTARTAICVIKDGRLIDRHIHNYNAAWSEEKRAAIVSRYRRYVERHGVNAIVVKLPPLQKHTKPLLQLMKRIEALAAKYHCEFDLTTKSELKHRTGTHSTSELMNYAVRLYPELSNLYGKSISNDHRYYKKLFEAVLSAHIFNERQRAKALQSGTTIK